MSDESRPELRDAFHLCSCVNYTSFFLLSIFSFHPSLLSQLLHKLSILGLHRLALALKNARECKYGAINQPGFCSGVVAVKGTEEEMEKKEKEKRMSWKAFFAGDEDGATYLFLQRLR